MAIELTPGLHYMPVFAILRWDGFHTETTPIEHRITVKKIVLDAEFAAKEVERLNSLNADKNCHYFFQITRIEKNAVESESVSA